MGKTKIILVIIMTLVLSMVLIIFFDYDKTIAKHSPKDLYKVYLDGDLIGVITSKEALEQYINNEQSGVKEIYGVDKVYPPKNLYIAKYISFNPIVLTEEEVYEKIKELNPFTIRGYIVKIEGENPQKLNVLDKNIFENAVNTTVEAFIPKEEYIAFLEEQQEDIKTPGKKIEDIYIDEKITIKEAFIPVDEHIFIDEHELSRYLLFGTLTEQKKYVVKSGDTIRDIAYNHQLGVGEFMLVNPQFNNPNNLLYEGQEVTVGLIEPIFRTVVEKHVVEDVIKKYQTEIIYDSNAAYGTSKVKQAGVDGLERVVQKLKYVSGSMTNAVIVNSEVLKVATNEVIVKGTRTNAGNIVISADGNWAWPTITPYIITSPYGWRWGRLHDGVDISGTGHGSPIYAANHGEVYRASKSASLGNYIVLRHDNEYYTIYAHLSKIYVTENAKVKRGNVIGAMGNTGFSTGTHLHFSVYIGPPYVSGSRSFDPLLLYR